MDTTFFINGGAGRVITSIPALEKFERLNPTNDFKIIVQGWEQLFWSHPKLQQRVFGSNQKGLFEQFVKNNNVVVPEPYQLNNFFNQQVNLVEAFDEIINKTNNHIDLNYSCLHLSTFELEKAKEVVQTYKQQTGKNKLIVFQPFGSAVEFVNHRPVDQSNRSLILENYLQIVKQISKDCVVVYASQPQFKHHEDKFSFCIDEQQNYLRTLIAIISQCDLFVGICSVGQHIARMFNKPSIILMGATNEKNFGYPENHLIYRKKDRIPIYMPWRLIESDTEFANRQNDGIMEFNEDEIREIINIIKKQLNYNETTKETMSLLVKYE